MSSPERENHRFSEEEEKEIAKVAIDLASAGEEAVWDAVINKNGLTLQIIELLDEGGNKVMETAKVLEHEVEIMNEVIKRAQAILKLEGRDTESQLKEDGFKASFGYFGDLEEGED